MSSSSSYARIISGSGRSAIIMFPYGFFVGILMSMLVIAAGRPEKLHGGLLFSAKLTINLQFRTMKL